MLGSRVRAPEGVLKEKNASSSLFFVVRLVANSDEQFILLIITIASVGLCASPQPPMLLLYLLRQIVAICIEFYTSVLLTY